MHIVGRSVPNNLCLEHMEVEAALLSLVYWLSMSSDTSEQAQTCLPM